MPSSCGKEVRTGKASIPETPLPDTKVDTQDNITPGFENLEHTKYRGIRSFTTTINQRTHETSPDTVSQYLSFSPVTQPQLTELEQIRDTGYKGLRFTYLNPEQTLLVRIMPGAVHEIATRALTYSILAKASEAGFRRGLVDMGTTTLSAPSGRKEGDTTFKPREFRRSKHSWPTLVIECGVTQSPPTLVAASHWWLIKSEGEVKIVIVLSVSESNRHINLQKWEPRMEPNQQGSGEDSNSFKITPVKSQEIDITDDAVTGAPLRLEFEKLMLREPHGKEGDLTFDAVELAEYAADIWEVTE